MSTDTAFRRAQVYCFLSEAFLYPHDDWTQDLGALNDILSELACAALDVGHQGWGDGRQELEALQAEYRRAIGLIAASCCETEYGLPHEFRQSQELADIAGFYRAFGFNIGGQVRERPDHLAAELEFMYILALKEAYASSHGRVELTEICADAERKFLRDHLVRWIGLFAERVAQNAPDSPYRALADFAATFVRTDAERLGVHVKTPSLGQVQPTPLGPDFTCGDVMSEVCPWLEYANDPR